MVDKDWQRPLTHHLAFLKLTAVELRRIAERVPEIANYLRYIADQIEADAANVARYLPDHSVLSGGEPRGFV